MIETIVVEGKDDEAAVRKAVDADIIKTNGFGITEDILRQIEWAKEKNGVIIFTDPDWAGEKIRKLINSKIPGCKNAYLDKNEAVKKNNIGVENADADSIMDSLSKAKIVLNKGQNIYSMQDMLINKLSGTPEASIKRSMLGKILRIGYGNSKQFLNRLNHYQIPRKNFKEALKKISR
ncbi:MAG: ribonuclease M5 [Deltaproteobacteria bacterium]|nr:MAG: ribonuclease M5 [Deltaproteobacteria bacterium]